MHVSVNRQDSSFYELISLTKVRLLQGILPFDTPEVTFFNIAAKRTKVFMSLKETVTRITKEK